MKSPLDRGFMPHNQRRFDFNVWSTKLNDEIQFPVTIFEAGDLKKSLENANQK